MWSKRFLGGFVVLPLILWLNGFMWYLHQISLPESAPQKPLDAIIVLTGGSQRLDVGFDLLSQGKAHKLFISGVHKDVGVKEIFYLNKASSYPLNNTVELGYAASNTRENARETAVWVQKKGYHSIGVVTAHYHMPRSLIEFRHQMPRLSIYSYPVLPELFEKTDWQGRVEQMMVLCREYHKFIGAIIRVQVSHLYTHSK